MNDFFNNVEVDQEELDQMYMKKAIDQAIQAMDRGEVPIGCVVVKNNKIVGKGYNQVETLKDATAHAEIIAITAASESLENWRLEGCTLYVTLEPCPMCAGAILNSRVTRVVYGAADHRLGACDTHFEVLAKNPINREIEVQSGVMEGDARGLLQYFFKELRIRNKERKRAN